jgi:hypothetical protein
MSREGMYHVQTARQERCAKDTTKVNRDERNGFDFKPTP